MAAILRRQELISQQDGTNARGAVGDCLVKGGCKGMSKSGQRDKPMIAPLLYGMNRLQRDLETTGQ